MKRFDVLDKQKTKKISRYNSFHIWYEGTSDTIETEELSIHVNIWRLKSKREKTFFDFGLMTKSSNVKRVHMFLPFTVKKDCIVDLGDKFKDVSILTGIFNADYRATTDSGSMNQVRVGDKDNGRLFNVYSLNIYEEMEVRSKYDGTVISFDVNGTSDAETLYYRFRVLADNYEPVLKCYRPKNTFFESAFIETEVIDFRINEHRNQPPKLFQEIVKGSVYKIKKIKLFLMTPLEDDVESDGQNFVFQRRLEEGSFWTDYLDMDYKDMNVYKCLNDVDDDGIFYCYSKIRYRRADIKTITKYIIFLGLFTILLGIISNALWWVLTSLVSVFFNYLS